MKLEDKLSVVNFFVNNPTFSIIEVSSFTGVSKSTVQRILSNPEYSDIITITGRTIKEQLEYNLKVGRKKGGINSFMNNTATKDSSGRFTGSITVQNGENNELKKIEDIKIIVDFYSRNPNLTLDVLTSKINQKYNTNYTRDYIYDCLLDSRVEELYGLLISSAISNNLTANYQGFIRKFGIMIFTIDELSKYELTDMEIAVLIYRFNNGTIKSATDAAKHFNCSKTNITNIENRALNKIKQKKLEEGKKIK